MLNSKFGVGLRPTHYNKILEILSGELETSVEWFEALSENYIDSEGRPLEMLEKVRSRFPVALHGIGMSIGSESGLDNEYLKSLKKLVERVEPFLVSDHLCWTGTANRPTHDLLPLPFTEESVQVVSSNIDRAQNFLGRPIAIENVSSYLQYKHSEMSEWEFISAIQKKTDCLLLLDINNIYVNSVNHKFNGQDFIDGIRLEAVKQLHLAGHTDTGEFLFDTHSDFVCDSVWDLYRYYLAKTQSAPAVLIEWDDQIPEWEVLEKESEKARDHWLNLSPSSPKDSAGAGVTL